MGPTRLTRQCSCLPTQDAKALIALHGLARRWSAFDQGIPAPRIESSGRPDTDTFDAGRKIYSASRVASTLCRWPVVLATSPLSTKAVAKGIESASDGVVVANGAAEADALELTTQVPTQKSF